jgi:DnaJ-class molecular chaperone
MRIFDRIEDVIKSYLRDEDSASYKSSSQSYYGDPDLDAAYEELNDYLKDGARGSPFDKRDSSAGARQSFRPPEPPLPASVRQSFVELGLPPSATLEECKAAYKKLLKIHHPDRHAGHIENMKKATEKSAKINTAFDRIERWRQTGKAD